MSASQRGVDVDVEAVREHYTRAIGAYRAAGERLAANPVQVAPESFGEGFTRHGARIAEALARVDDTTATYLRTRTQNWAQIMRLASVVAHTDADNAAGYDEGEL